MAVIGNVITISEGTFNEKPTCNGIRQIMGCQCVRCGETLGILGIDQDTGNGNVDLFSGQVRISSVDLQIRCKGFDWIFERTYISGLTYHGPLGHNWDFSHNRRLFVEKDNSVLRMDGYGRSDLYKSVNDRYDSPRGFYTKLSKNQDGSFVERDKEGNYVLYSAPDDKCMAHMIEIGDRNDNKMIFSYDSERLLTKVFDTFGRSIFYLYDSKGRLSTIRDFGDRELRFEYDDESNLIAVNRLMKKSSLKRTTLYRYCSKFADEHFKHNIKEIIAPNEASTKGPPYLQFEYATDKKSSSYGKVITQRIGGKNSTGITSGGMIAYEYSRKNLHDNEKEQSIAQTDVTNRNGNYNEYQFNQDGNLLRLRKFANRHIRLGDSKYFEYNMRYNNDGEIIEFQQPEGNVIEYSYDENNEDSLQHGNMLVKILTPDKNRGGDQKMLKTTYTYEPIFNQLKSKTEPRGNDPTFMPQNDGKIDSERYTSFYIFDYQEGENFKEISRKSGRSESEVKSLLAKAKVTLGRGDINHDGNTDQTSGNVVQEISPKVNLLPDSNIAKAQKNIIQQIEKTYSYNKSGQLTTVVDPEGAKIIYDYYPEDNPDGNNLNLTSKTSNDLSGYLKQITRNTKDDPVLQPCIDATPRSIVTNYSYDRFGNVTQVIDARGVTTEYRVNEFDQTIEITRAADIIGDHGSNQELADSTKNSSRDGNNMIAYRYKTFLEFDSNGNVVTKEVEDRDSNNGKPNDAKIKEEFKRDILGNVVEKVEHVSRGKLPIVTRYRYDHNENLVLVISPVANLPSNHPQFQAGNVMSYVFDERDKIFTYSRGGITNLFCMLKSNSDIPEISSVPHCSNTYAVRHRYDGNGNPVELADVPNKEGIDRFRVTYHFYDGFDRHVSSIDSFGTQTLLQYDPAGNIVRKLRYGTTGVRNALNISKANVRQPLKTEEFTQSLLTEEIFKYDELSRMYENDKKIFKYDDVQYKTLTAIQKGNTQWKTSRYEYDRKNRLVFRVEENARTHSTFYNSMDWECSTIDPEGNEIRYTYDANGNIMKIVEVEITRRGDVQSGRVPALEETFTTINVFDSLNRLVRITNNLGLTFRFQYDSRDNQISVSDAQYSDQTGDLINDPLGLFPANGQDSRGVTKINPPGNTVDYFYDDLGRVISKVCSLRVSGQGKNQIDSTNPYNPDGKIIIDFEWDANGRLVAMSDDGSSPENQNTSVGVIESLNPKGNATRYDYDDKDRCIRESYPDGSIVEFNYGAPFTNDEIDSMIDANGSEIHYDYDSLGALRGRNFHPSVSNEAHLAGGYKDTSVNWQPIGTRRQSFSFDGEGRLIEATDSDYLGNNADPQNDIVQKFRYDSSGSLIEEEQYGLVISSDFDNSGRMISLQYPNRRVLEMSYDKLDQLIEIKDRGATGPPIARYDYIGPTRVLQRTYKNGAKLTYLDNQARTEVGYDGSRRITSHKHLTQNGGLVAGFAYEYDRSSNRLAETRLHEGNLRQNFSYDSNSRLRSITSPGGVTETLKLDGVGNWRNHNNLVNDVNTLNQYASFEGSRQIYDMNGNLIDDGMNYYQYDVLNRLRKVTRKSDNAIIATYRYDCFNRRTEKIVTNMGEMDDSIIYLYSGWQEIEARHTNKVLQYVYGLDVDEILTMDVSSLVAISLGTLANSTRATTLFFHEDANKNCACITDIDGDLVEKYSYGTFGQPAAKDANGVQLDISSITNSYLFASRRYDSETGFYYFVNRYLNPNQGRFITRDPLGTWVDIYNSGNAYTYVNNNPVNQLDPFGLTCGAHEIETGCHYDNFVDTDGTHNIIYHCDCVPIVSDPDQFGNPYSGPPIVPSGGGTGRQGNPNPNPNGTPTLRDYIEHQRIRCENKAMKDYQKCGKDAYLQATDWWGRWKDGMEKALAYTLIPAIGEGIAHKTGITEEVVEATITKIAGKAIVEEGKAYIPLVSASIFAGHLLYHPKSAETIAKSALSECDKIRQDALKECKGPLN